MYWDEGIGFSDFLNKLQISTKDNPGFWGFFFGLFSIFFVSLRPVLDVQK